MSEVVMDSFDSRTRMLIGDEAADRLARAKVIVFGCGGVGSYIIEALARAGVGHLVVVDGDTVAESNINRQIIATVDTVGRAKTEVVRERIAKINPDCIVEAVQMFYLPENADEIDFAGADFIADAIDTVSAKVEIIARAKAVGVPVISSMGTGNKLDPTRFRITDISKTSVCPLARAMRRLLKDRGITGVKVLYSEEEPIKASTDENGKPIPASISYVPSVAGLMIAGEIIRTIAGV